MLGVQPIFTYIFIIFKIIKVNLKWMKFLDFMCQNLCFNHEDVVEACNYGIHDCNKWFEEILESGLSNVHNS